MTSQGCRLYYYYFIIYSFVTGQDGDRNGDGITHITQIDTTEQVKHLQENGDGRWGQQETTDENINYRKRRHLQENREGGLEERKKKKGEGGVNR